jgi:hypothetical protein
MDTFFGKYRGLVEDNLDPHGLGRLEVSSADVWGDGVRAWAMPCLPYANPGLGVLMLPPVRANVWLEFERGDPDHPVWTGCFWTTAIPPELGRDEVVISTQDGSTVKLDAAGITVTSSGALHVSASTVDLSAATITLEAGMVKTSGVVQCDTLIANSVVAASYTPGAGNIW